MATTPSSQIIGRRYVLHERLGAGGMGAVYRATDRLSGQRVALKRVTMPAEQLEFASRGHGTNPQLSLAQEFTALASLRHPNIIHVLDYGFDQERRPFFTMDLLEDAQTIVAAGQGQALDMQVALLVQCLQALVYLHRRNVLHRDIKPENVLVVAGQAMVLDFGLSVTTSRTMEYLTQTTAGTMAYLAPELFQGAPVTRAADLYAVGIMAYEVFVGRHPFDTRNMAVLVTDVLNKPVDVWSTGVGDELAAVLERLLAKSREERYDDAGEVIRDLCAATGCAVPAETVEIRESFLQAARFVGRESELQQLLGALDAALVGCGSAWLVGGESGIGKSRLVGELRTLALVAGASVLRGQAVREGGRPFHLWRDVLRRLALTADLTVKEASVFKTLVPHIADWVGRDVPDAPALDPKATLARWTWTASQVIDRQERPLVVILEDLQWAGSESLAMLDRLVQRAGPRRMLLVGTYRDEERPELPNELPEMEVLTLGRLREQDVAELSVSMLGPVGRREPVLDLLQRETGGNPFFLVEVVRALAEEAGHLDRIDTTRLPPAVLRAGAPQLVQRRLDRIPEDARPLLELAAVAGTELDLDLLRSLAPQVDLERWLTTCADEAVLEVVEGRWRFAHDKLRERVLETLAGDTELHWRVAETLERCFPERAEMQAARLAYHYAQAERWGRAQEYLFKAGDQAGRVAADAEALAYYQQAMAAYTRAFGDQWDPMQRAALEHKMGQALFRLGQHEQALEYLLQALAHLGKPLPTSRWCVRLAILGEIATHVGHRLSAGRLLKPMERMDSSALEDEFRLYETLGWIHMMTNQRENLLLDALRGANLSERGRYFLGTVMAYAGLAVTGDFTAHFWLAEHYCQSAVALAEQIQHPIALGRAYQMLGIHELFRGRWDSACEHGRRAVEAYQEASELRGWGLALWVIAFSLNCKGDLVQASACSQELVRLAQDGGDQEIWCWGLYELGVARGHLGRLQEAAATLARSIKLADLVPDHLSRAGARGQLGQCYLRQGELERALAILEEGQHLRIEYRVGAHFATPILNGLAEAYLLAAERSSDGSTERARWLRKAGRACHAALRQGRAFRGGTPEAMRLRGRYEWLRGWTASAKKWWQRGLSLAEEMEQRYDLGLTHLEMGQRLGEREHLERAAVIFRELGAEWDLARAREALSQTPAVD